MEQAPQKTVKHLVQAAAEEICRSLAVMPWNAMMKEGAGRRLLLDLIICTSLILFAVIEKLEISQVELLIEHFLEGQLGRGTLDYAIKFSQHIRIVVKEARKDQLDEYVGLLLAQMAAVRDVNITSKRKQDDPDMAVGVLTNGKEWLGYVYDSSASNPVQYSSIKLDLTDKNTADVVEVAVRPGLEFLLGLYKTCWDFHISIAEEKA